MRTYTTKERRQLARNPYTYKVTDHTLSFTVEFKKEFWRRYEADEAPTEILRALGYDTNIFSRKQISNIVQSIKHQAMEGDFREGYARRRTPHGNGGNENEVLEATDENVTRLWNEVQYLRQAVDAIIRLRPECVVPRGASR